MSKRKPTKKFDASRYCVGCLSIDRQLKAIDGFYEIYLAIMANDVDEVEQAEVPKMCFECRALLRKAQEFRERAMTAQELIAGGPKKLRKLLRLSNIYTSSPGEIIFMKHVEISDDIFVLSDSDTLSNDENIEEAPPFQEPVSETKEMEEVKDVPDETEIENEPDVKIKKEPDIEKEPDIVKEPDIEKEPVIEKEPDIEIKEEPYVKDEEPNVIASEPDVNLKEEMIVIEEHGLEETETKTRPNILRKGRAVKAKYKIISMNTKDSKRDLYKKVSMDDKERLFWLEKTKQGRKYSIFPFKCDLCLTGFSNEEYYNQHMMKNHSESNGRYSCDICSKRVALKSKLLAHIKEHYTKYVCTLCNYECHQKWKKVYHLQYAHQRAIVCLTCGDKFNQRPEFYQHYKDVHTKLICDYCGKTFTRKQQLMKHISNQHNENKCIKCDRRYSSRHALKKHVKMHHEITADEDSYCVECNIQFINVAQYDVHLKTSVKHRTIVGIPCPECNKVYNKKNTMNNHYKYVHLKKTNHYCEKCSRYFLNSFRLRQHIASVHDKIPPVKNKMCPQCGRAFSTNRMLDNHIRTHTGERPFACTLCTSKFAQRTALMSHLRSIHKILNFK